MAPNVVTYSAVAKGYAALGRLAEAQAVLSEMGEVGVLPSAITFNALISCCVRQQNTSQVRGRVALTLTLTLTLT